MSRILLSSTYIVAALLNSALGQTINIAVGSPAGGVVYATDAGVQPYDVTEDASGAIYVADANTGTNRILKLSNGILTVVAGGNTAASYGGDKGPAVFADLNSPRGVVLDAQGNLYISDMGNNRIRKVTPSGMISTLAGNGTPTYGGDNNLAINASIYGPEGLTLGPGGAVVFADTGNNRVRMISSAGIISTIAGTGAGTFGGENVPAGSAQLYSPQGVVFDSAGNLFIADTANHRVRKVTPGGIITTYAGTGIAGYNQDGILATNALLNSPTRLAIDSTGSLLVADSSNNRIRRIDSKTLMISTIAGNGSTGGSDGGQATNAGLGYPQGIYCESGGRILIADDFSFRIRSIAPDGTISSILNGSAPLFQLSLGDGGPATSASLNLPTSVSLDLAGDLYFIDQSNDRIRRVDAVTGDISTVAGGGTGGECTDGSLATSCSLSCPYGGLAFDRAGDIFFPDTCYQDIGAASRTRRIDAKTGVITTVPSPQGTYITGMAVDGRGDVFFAAPGVVRGNEKGYVLEVTPGASTFSTYAVVQPPSGQTNIFPSNLAIDVADNIYFTASASACGPCYILPWQQVMRIDALTQAVTVVAGTVNSGFSGDHGPATSAALNNPGALATDSVGNLYICDTGNYRVRRVDAVTQIITTVAGNGSPAYSGDGGPALLATGGFCGGLAFDYAGDLLLSDPSNNRIRVIEGLGDITPTVTLAANATDNAPTISPNTWIDVQGTNLVPANTPAQGVDWSTAPSFASGQMPTQLNNISVTVNGKPAYVYFYCSAATDPACALDQINILTPPDPLPAVAQVVVTNGNVTASFSAQAQTITPSFFLLNGGPYVAARHLNYGLLGPATLYPGASTPAAPGEVILLYANGFGPTSIPVVSGSASQSGTLTPFPMVQIAGISANVVSANLVSPGLFQFAVTVPSLAPGGDQPIVATYGGLITQPGTLLTILP